MARPKFWEGELFRRESYFDFYGKAIYLKDIIDIFVREEVKKMIISISKTIKCKNNYLLDEDDYLLLNDNIKVVVNEIIKLINKKDLNFNIPAQFIEYISEGKHTVIYRK